MAESVLVVDDDPDVVAFLKALLTSAGYEVAVASTGDEGLRRAIELTPDLVILDVMMPEIDGFELARQIRANPRTSSASIIMVTAKGQSVDKVLGLASGADDYVIKPFDSVELLARVGGTLRRAREMRAVSPLTGLAGNVRIQEELRRRITERRSFALMYVDIDHFKAYNDRYGFERGDQAIKALARLATRLVHELVPEDWFVGHVGGDDFVLIVPSDTAEELAASLCRCFESEIAPLYDEADLARGMIEVQDRQGNLVQFPLLSLSIGVATTNHRSYRHVGEVVAVASEMKQLAKQQSECSIAIDRRVNAAQAAADDAPRQK